MEPKKKKKCFINFQIDCKFREEFNKVATDNYETIAHILRVAIKNYIDKGGRVKWD